MNNNHAYQIVKQFFGILTPTNHRQILLIFLMLFVVMFLEMIGVGLIIPMIKFLLNADYIYQYPSYILLTKSIFGDASPQSTIYCGILVILFIFLCKALFLSFYIYRQTSFIFNINRTLGERLFVTYLNQPYIFHINNNSSKLIQNVIAEVGMFSGMVITSFLYIATELFVLLGILTVLLYAEPLATFIIAGTLVLFTFTYNFLTKKSISKWGEWRQVAETMRVQSIQEGIMSIKQSILLGRKKFFFDKFNHYNAQSCNVNSNQTLVLSLPKIWLEFLAICTIFILVFLVDQNKSSDIESLLPTLALFGAAAFKILPSINRILNSSQQMRYAVPNIKKLYTELNNTKNTTKSKSNKLNDSINIKLRKKISIKNIYFSYPGTRKKILNGSSLNIFFGQCVGIVGPSGSGKSTLVDNILGLFKPQSGEITVDDININSNIRSWQNQIGYVSQSLYLMDASITSNVAFGIPPKHVNNKSVIRALKMAQLDKYIKLLPNGRDTILGEGGIKLSGGQRQRIGIARALYHNPSVIVLDEATNSLDIKTENQVIRTVMDLKGIKTIIMVSHRESTLTNCDRIFRVDSNGKITKDYSLLLKPKLGIKKKQ